MTTRVCRTLVVAACLLCGGVAHAQVARSQFNGTVTDSAGGVLVGAVVTATNAETNVESKATTTGAGIYVMPYLASGLYRIIVSAPGFRPAESTEVTLRAAQTLTLDFKLEVDAITETMTVTAPVIETSTAEIGHYVSTKEFQTWPIAVGDGQRQIQQFIFSSLPGHDRRHVRGGHQRRPQLLARDPHRGHSARPQPAGGQQQRDVAADRSHLGVQAPDRHAGRRVRRRPDGGRELRRQVGTNQLHGSGAVYLMDDSWDAKPFVAKALGQATPERDQQNWAVAMGGPISLPKLYSGKDRSFFFATFEQTHAEEQTSTAFRSLPTREFQNGDFSRLFDAGYTGDARSGTVVGTDALGRPIRFGQIYDPRTTRVVDGRVTRDPFPNNQVPRAVWDPVARNTLEQGLWDTPELDRLFNNQPVLGTCCPVFEQNTFATKLDQVINAKHRASFYINREWRTRNNSPAGRYGQPPGSPTNLYQLQNTPSWLIRASENWVISDRLLHRFSFGYNRFGNDNRSVYFNQGWPSKIGLRNQPDTTFPRFAFGGTAILGNLGNFGSHLARRELRGQHDCSGRPDLRDRAPQHQDRLRGAFLLRRQRDCRRDGHLQLQLGADEPAGIRSADRPCLRELPPWRRADVQPSCPGGQHGLLPARFRLLRAGRLQGLVQAHAQPRAAVGHRAGILREERLRDEPRSRPCRTPRPATVRAPCASPTRRTGRGSSTRTTARCSRGWASPTRCRRIWRSSGGYSVSHRAATAYSGGEDFGGLNSTGYNGTISVTGTPGQRRTLRIRSCSSTTPTPASSGTLPNYDPTQLNNQGFGQLIGERGQARAVPQLQRHAAASAPGELLDDARLHRRTGPRSAVRPAFLFDGNQINRTPFDAVARYGDLLFSNLSSQPQLGIPLPYPGFKGTVQQALRPYPQYTGITLLNSFRGKTRYNSLQTTLERHFSKGFALVAAYTLSKTEDNYLKQDASGEEWDLAGGGRHFPHFLKLTWIYELPDRTRQGDQRRRRAGQHHRRLDAHRHPQLPDRRHAERVRQPHQQPRQHRVPLPSRRRRRCGSRSSSTGRTSMSCAARRT